MLFAPQTPLETLLVQAYGRPTDARAYTAFVRELMSAVVGVLGRREPHGFQPLVLSPAGTAGVCVFTHPARYDTFAAELMLPSADWQVRTERVRPLFEWAAVNRLYVLLNPGSDPAKEFPAVEVERLLRGQWL